MTTLRIDTPPKEGFYKLQIFGAIKPKRPGRIKLPLMATFLVDYRHRRQTNSIMEVGRIFPPFMMPFEQKSLRSSTLAEDEIHDVPDSFTSNFPIESMANSGSPEESDTED